MLALIAHNFLLSSFIIFLFLYGKDFGTVSKAYSNNLLLQLMLAVDLYKYISKFNKETFKINGSFNSAINVSDTT